MQFFSSTCNSWNNILHWPFQYIEWVSMYSILLNIFEVESTTVFFCLLKSGNNMLYGAKNSVCCCYINNLFQCLAVFEHVTITTTSKHSFTQNFADEVEIVSLRILTTLGFAEQTKHFHAVDFSKEATALIIVFLMLRAASTRKEICCSVDWKIVHTVFALQRITLFFKCRSDIIIQIFLV